METTLCWIGVGLWVYGWVLRRYIRRERIEQRPSWLLLEHTLFLAGVGTLAGSLAHSLFDAQRSLRMLMTIGGVVGGVLGSWQGWRRGQTPEQRRETLTADMEWIDTSSSAVLLAAVIMYLIVQAFKIPSGSMRETLREGDHLFVNKFIYGVRIPWTDRRIWRFRSVARGEVVVFLCPPVALSPAERARRLNKDFIKRVIGLPGDRVEIRRKQVLVNGQSISEPYAHLRDLRSGLGDPVTIPSERYQQAWEEGQLVEALVSGGTRSVGTPQQPWEEEALFERARFAVRDNFGPVTVPPGSYLVMGDNRDGSYDSRFWGPLPARFLKGKAWVLYWPLRRIKVIH